MNQAMLIYLYLYQIFLGLLGGAAIYYTMVLYKHDKEMKQNQNDASKTDEAEHKDQLSEQGNTAQLP